MLENWTVMNNGTLDGVLDGVDVSIAQAELIGRDGDVMLTSRGRIEIGTPLLIYSILYPEARSRFIAALKVKFP